MPDMLVDEDSNVEDERDPSDDFWKTKGDYSAHALDNGLQC
jgi:hypothetical protein